MKFLNKNSNQIEIKTRSQNNSFNESLKKNLAPANFKLISQALEQKQQIKQNLLNNDSLFKKSKINSFQNTIKVLETTSDPYGLKNKIQDYNNIYQNNVNIYRDKKEENDEFLNNYSLLKKKAEENAMKKPGSINGPECTFKDLIYSYRQKEYKIPDFSVEKNLFKPSPLLLDENKLIGFYKSNKDISNSENNKELYFLHNLNSQINDMGETENEKFKAAYKKEESINLRQSVILLRKFEEESKNKPIGELKDEIRNIEKENKQSRERYKEYLKKTKTLSNNSNNQTLIQQRVSGIMSTDKSSFDNERVNNEDNKNIRLKLFNKATKKFSIMKSLIMKSQGSLGKKIKFNLSTNTNTGLNSAVESLNISQSQNVLDNTGLNNILMSNNLNTISGINNVPSIIPGLTEIIAENKFSRKVVLSPIVSQLTSSISGKKMTYNKILKSNFLHKNANFLEIGSIERSMVNKSSFNNLPTYFKKITSDIKFSKADSIMHMALPKPEKITIEALYEKATKKDFTISLSNPNATIYEDIEKFLKESKKYDSLMDYERIQPRHLMRNITDLKAKVGNKDVYNSYIGISDKIGNVEIDVNSLHKIRELDIQINNFEKYLIRSLNSGQQS